MKFQAANPHRPGALLDVWCLVLLGSLVPGAWSFLMPYIDQFLSVIVEQGGSDLHIGEGQPPKMRRHGDVMPIREEPVTREEAAGMLSEICGAAKLGAFRRARRSRFRLRDGCELAFSLQFFEADQWLWRGFSSDPDQDRHARAAWEFPPVVKRVRTSARRPGAGHRSDRVGKIDDAGGVDRLHKRKFFAPHRDDRGADRVRARQQAQHHHAARSAGGFRFVSRRAEGGVARRCGHRARR